MQNSGKNQWALSRALSRALYGHCMGTVRALSWVQPKEIPGTPRNIRMPKMRGYRVEHVLAGKENWLPL